MRDYREIAERVKKDVPELENFTLQAVIALWSSFSEDQYFAVFMIYREDYVREFKDWILEL